ncbi:MAG: hypothetical protein ACOYXB_00530 [Bacteroidota bacterium]
MTSNNDKPVLKVSDPQVAADLDYIHEFRKELKGILKRVQVPDLQEKEKEDLEAFTYAFGSLLDHLGHCQRVERPKLKP